jgi:hypothetical protein
MPSQNGGTRHEETKEGGSAEYAESKGDPKLKPLRVGSNPSAFSFGDLDPHKADSVAEIGETRGYGEARLGRRALNLLWVRLLWHVST